jgi:hypothetical protein
MARVSLTVDLEYQGQRLNIEQDVAETGGGNVERIGKLIDELAKKMKEQVSYSGIQ